MIDDITRNIQITDNIKSLENVARRNRPATAPMNRPLTDFLPEHEANMLRHWREEKKKMKQKEQEPFTDEQLEKAGLRRLVGKKGETYIVAKEDIAVVESVKRIGGD